MYSALSQQTFKNLCQSNVRLQANLHRTESIALHLREKLRDQLAVNGRYEADLLIAGKWKAAQAKRAGCSVQRPPYQSPPQRRLDLTVYHKSPSPKSERANKISIGDLAVKRSLFLAVQKKMDSTRANHKSLFYSSMASVLTSACLLVAGLLVCLVNLFAPTLTTTQALMLLDLMAY